MPSRIRPFVSEDIHRLIEIFKLNVPKYFDPSEVADFKTYINQEPDAYLVIESDGTIVGGCGYYVNQEKQTGSVAWIFLHPDSSGQGLGRSIVERCHQELKKDARVKRLTVRTSQLADAFFEKFGYRTTKTVKNHWGQGLDLVEMERAV